MTDSYSPRYQQVFQMALFSQLGQGSWTIMLRPCSLAGSTAHFLSTFVVCHLLCVEPIRQHLTKWRIKARKKIEKTTKASPLSSNLTKSTYQQIGRHDSGYGKGMQGEWCFHTLDPVTLQRPYTSNEVELKYTDRGTCKYLRQ